VLTGPISSVAAGQYIIGLAIEAWNLYFPESKVDDAPAKILKAWGSVVIAVGTTVYFWWQNVKGIHESSEKALRIMLVTTKNAKF
jgi:uncharacterized protein YjeT (DUF2065 family)